ncbi:MAG: amidohydrolase [Gammaproteobacteria bacterium]|nr:amidohydrolase [Gammaproteobacteria bacterium]MBU2676439.1 amidohydrolase [Gammaproteobacteria bacterium]NNC57899.1 amidohydrolase [Woeseiaceae bacterium]NNL50174.1 amidohydrolase [Woeseiaceae bacterium]
MTQRLACLAAVLIVSPGFAADLRESIAQDYDAHLADLFTYLHANPELSMQEFETSDRMASELEAAGYTITRNIGKTGLAGTLRNGDGPVLMIRADMDGLPVLEKTDLDYKSTAKQVNLEGIEMPVMHACGHDMHMTTLVGVARRMAALRDRWQGTLLLVGQPAEEAEGGAKAMVADGLYDRVGRPDFALALHVSAGDPLGKITFSDGLMYSSADTVRINVRGVATHGASPHLGKDPILIGSQIVVALQSIVTREVGPLEPAVITVGAFRGGTAPNVIADHARLDITVRANTEETRYQLLDSIERVAINTARAAGVPEDLLPEVIIYSDGAPTTNNDAALARRVRAAMQAGMGANSLMEYKQTDMGAEDFPDLVNVDPPIPSVYFQVGGTPVEDLESGNWAGHHSGLFRIDPEGSVTAGVEAMTLAALEVLGRPPN